MKNKIKEAIEEQSGILFTGSLSLGSVQHILCSTFFLTMINNLSYQS